MLDTAEPEVIICIVDKIANKARFFAILLSEENIFDRAIKKVAHEPKILGVLLKKCPKAALLNIFSYKQNNQSNLWRSIRRNTLYYDIPSRESGRF